MRYTIYALMLSALTAIVLGPIVIPWLRRIKFGQTERELGPKSHLVKQGTPTIGGIIILFGMVVGTVAFANSSFMFAIPAVLFTLAFALLGFMDDFLKVKRRNTDGLKAYQKIIGQFLIALVIAIYAYRSPYIGSSVYLAFFNAEWDMGILYIPFIIFVVVSCTNSVNLLDGLDGLASGCTMIYALAMSVIFGYMAGAVLTPADAGQASMTEYAAGLQGMSVFAASVAGGCMGFLRSNAYPAKVFMGDTGALALGGAVACMAIFSRAVFLMPIMGICFVASSVSVILQVGSYKLRGKRIFKMAPLHHHFELLGYPETRIVTMYMVVTAFACLLCLLAFV